MKWPAQRLTGGSKKSFGMYDEAAKLDAAGVDRRVRGEALSLQQLCRVADAIGEMTS